MANSPPIPEAPTAMPALPATSLWARLMNVFVTPGEVFDEVKHRAVSAANWVTPALILVFISWVGCYVIFSQDAFRHQVTDAAEQAAEKQFQKMEKEGKATKENIEKSREMVAKFAVGSAVAGSLVVGVLAAFATPFWWGLIIWVVGTKALKGTFPFMKGVEVAGLANTIACLDALLRILLIIVTGSLFASAGLAMLVKNFNPQNPLHGALMAFNVMTFWVLAVRSMGLARLTGASFAKAAAWLFGIWLFFTALMIGFSAAMQAVGKALTTRSGG